MGRQFLPLHYLLAIKGLQDVKALLVLSRDLLCERAQDIDRPLLSYIVVVAVEVRYSVVGIALRNCFFNSSSS